MSLGLGACVLALAACSDSSAAPTLSPVTGVIVPAADLTRVRGCGTGTTEIYKYAVVVSPASADGGTTAPVARGVYDCFVDAMFLGGSSTALPVGIDGTATYALDVVALTSSEYEKQRAFVDDLAKPSTVLDLPKFLNLLGWRYHCDGTMRQDVTSVAACSFAGGGG